MEEVLSGIELDSVTSSFLPPTESGDDASLSLLALLKLLNAFQNGSEAEDGDGPGFNPSEFDSLKTRSIRFVGGIGIPIGSEFESERSIVDGSKIASVGFDSEISAGETGSGSTNVASTKVS